MKIVSGLLAMGLGAMFAFYGYVRLGIGRHGDVWWKPFTNPLSAAHVENLASLALGIAGIALGAWIVVAALRRA
jgi:hypothetical protein